MHLFQTLRWVFRPSLRSLITGLDTKLNKIMDTQAEEADALNALADQANKIFGEISAKIDHLDGTIASLEDAVKLGGQPTQAVQDAFARVRDGLKKLDDIVPDAVPVTPPVETPPAEPPAPVATPDTP